jgi:hypothetical protein
MAVMKKVVLALATAGLLSSGAAQAALVDRGGGLLYDDVLNVTWLQDANYAKTSGYDADGLMTWAQAKTWASNLIISRTAAESLTGWRLASNAPVNGTWNHSQPVTSATGTWNENFSGTGSSDSGYNIMSQNNELAYMYYVNLGLKGATESGYGVPGTINGQAKVGLVNNLVEKAYWSGTAYAPSPADRAWEFNTVYGLQEHLSQSGGNLAAWAVRPGDVAAVPEPETYAMLLAGLGLMAGVARRRKQK